MGIQSKIVLPALLSLILCSCSARRLRAESEPGPGVDHVASHTRSTEEPAPAHNEHAPPATAEEQSVPEKSELTQAHEQITKLQEKVQDLETRISALNDKINLENGVKPSETGEAKAIAEENVKIPAAHAKVVPLPKAGKKSEEIFVQNEAVDRFREAKILLDSQRYSDSVLEFSEFVKTYPDHPLAAGAQYYVGISYAFQGEYKLADAEFSRVLLSYPHSNYVPDTLAALAEIAEKLDQTPRSNYYRQKLLTSFPNSPQAKALGGKTEAPKSVHSKTAHVDHPAAPVVPTAELDEPKPAHPEKESSAE